MNRFADSVLLIERKLALLSPEKVTELGKKLDMSPQEHFIFQEKKTLAFASEKISLEEATYLFTKLGGTVEVFNRQPVAVKVVLTQTFALLLKG